MVRSTLLNNVDHQDLRVDLAHGAQYGDAINQVLVFPTEFEELQREYPIFFRKDEAGEYLAIALLGLDRDENLYLDGNEWKARYVPAVQARGPFLIGLHDREVDGETQREPMVHVDLDHPRVGAENGYPVFLPHGGNSPYLDRIATVLQRLHRGVEIAPAMFAAFEQAGLIEPVALDISLSETEQYRVPDCFTIGAEALATLEGAQLESLNRAGFLALAFHVLASVGNVGRLIEMKNARRGA